jgi:hypothetical protein
MNMYPWQYPDTFHRASFGADDERAHIIPFEFDALDQAEIYPRLRALLFCFGWHRASAGPPLLLPRAPLLASAGAGLSLLFGLAPRAGAL